MSPEQPVPPTTTTQQDITKAGQRKVNLIWEYTQAIIAVLIVFANISVWIASALNPSVVKIPPSLSDALFVIVGFYYGRTNHAAIGGIGPKPHEEYGGR